MQCYNIQLQLWTLISLYDSLHSRPPNRRDQKRKPKNYLVQKSIFPLYFSKEQIVIIQIFLNIVSNFIPNSLIS